MFIFCKTACKVGNKKKKKKNRELPGSLTTAKRLLHKVTVLQSDPTANKFFINCIFLHSYNLLTVFWKSKQRTHITTKLKITDAIHACNYCTGKQHLLKNFTYCFLWQENGFMKETNLSRSSLQSCCILETTDTGLHVTIMTIQYGHLFLSH